MNARSQTLKIEKAIELHKAGRLSEAEVAYRAILRARPNDADALHFLGMLRMHQGRRPEAIELVRRSLKQAPNNCHAWNNLGNMLLDAKRHDEAEEAYRRATSIAPDMAQAWYNLGATFRRTRRPADALGSFRRALDLDPKLFQVYESLGSLLYRMRDHAQAAEVYRKWLEVEPGNPIAAHMLAAVTGQSVPERAADGYVARHFDSFADSFDDKLKQLGYAAPQLLAGALAERVRFGERRSDVLDAGCGTGLCGVLLRSTAKRLVGVDLSAGMLEKARQRKTYDELVEAELCAFMRSRPASFDIINCADTLVYFGALEEAAAAAALCLRPDGVFAFTVEAEPAGSEHRYRIRDHGRYSHGGDYVTTVLRAAGFVDVEVESVELRKELSEGVAGHLVVARLPT